MSTPAQQRTEPWQCGSFCFERTRPLVMGVLNITPDSFSDGGKYLEPSNALRRANAMRQQGADIIDVGGESTRPGSQEVSLAEERARVLPVVEALVQEGFCVSIDSRHAKVVEACLAAGAAIINDITGFSNPAMAALAASSKAGCVIMHMQGQPRTMQEAPHYHDVVKQVSEYLLAQAALLEQHGVEHNRICIDPGPGFGKDYAQNLALLKATAHFAALNTAAGRASGCSPFPLLAAWSRKRFIGEVTDIAEPAARVAGSVAAAAWAATQGATVLRVHDVGATVEALKLLAVVEA